MKVILALLVSLRCFAGTIQIISAADLQNNFGRYRVIDARNRGEGEIPGAVRVGWKDWTVERPNLWNSLFGDVRNWGKVAEDDIPERLGKLGIGNATPVVVFGDRKEWGEEGRIAWALLYWGVDNVSLLDGGYAAWAALPKKDVIPRPLATEPFVLRVEEWRRAQLSDVKATSRPLFDARSTEEYRGKTMPGQKRGGHLPGAMSLPLASLYEADGKYVSRERLEALTGPLKGKLPIAYCTGGVRSALLALLLEARLGIRTANYDGSIWEWAAYKELPLIID